MITPQISVFEAVNNSKYPIGVTHLSTALDEIRCGKYKEVVEKIRGEKDEGKQKILKGKLPAFTIAGVFEERKKDMKYIPSGFMCVDIDAKDNNKGTFDELVERVKQDKHTFALFRSCRGEGVAIIVKINPEKYSESFRWAMKYYADKYGLKCDPSVGFPSSLRAVSYDQDCIIKENSTQCGTLEAPKYVNKPKPKGLTKQDECDFITQVVASGKDIAPTYDEYLSLSFALANGFGETGRQYFHDICRVNHEYSEAHAEKLYNTALEREWQVTAKITIGTLYFLAKRQGIEPPKGRKEILQRVLIHKEAGTPKEEVVRELVEVNKMEVHSAGNMFDAVAKDEELTLEEVAQTGDKNISVLTEWIKKSQVNVCKNVITRKVEINGSPMTEDVFNFIYLQARQKISKEITKDIVYSILNSAYIPQVHPIKEYIERNKWRTSEGNIDKLCACVVSNTRNKDLHIRKWIISLIAAVYGHPVRSMLVIIGRQGTGKTQFFRRLLPNDLKAYLADSKLDEGKDASFKMCENLIICNDEMGGRFAKDEKTFKEFSSKEWFTERQPYGRMNDRYRRLAVLCGTSNLNEVITDFTGNTRILPIDIVDNKIDRDLYNSIDKDELFMEAVRCYERGDEYELNDEEMEVLRTEVSPAFTISFSEEEMLLKYFRKPTEGEEGFMTSTEILDFLTKDTRVKITKKRLGTFLGQYFERDQIRRNSFPVKGWKITFSNRDDKNDESIVFFQD